MKKTLFPFGSSSRNSGRAMRATSLRLENLEDRQLLSVTDLVPLAAAASESAVETAPAAEDVAIDLSSVADQTETAYNEHDLAAVESLGMTADDSNVVWNAEGRVTSIVASAQTTLETANLSGCTALESFTCKGTVRAPNALASLDGYDRERISRALGAAGIDPGRRAESLTLEEFARLADSLQEA